ncbi:hypothetical protein [Dialister succinatiphilus]|nr:hypothetical protein [Dialister succinatiphilus]
MEKISRQNGAGSWGGQDRDRGMLSRIPRRACGYEGCGRHLK